LFQCVDIIYKTAKNQPEFNRKTRLCEKERPVTKTAKWPREKVLKHNALSGFFRLNLDSGTDYGRSSPIPILAKKC